jgi:hypothetical protein
MDDNEIIGEGQFIKGISAINDGNRVSGNILHYPTDCVNDNGDQISCVYAIAVQNLNSESDHTIQITIVGEFYNPGDVELGKEYKDTINHGESIRYELNPFANPDMAYLKKLKIILNSLQGDADLFVSFTNPNPNTDDFDFASRRTSQIDQVVIEEEGGLDMNSLNRTIFFSVIGIRRTQYVISFEYEYLHSFDEKLQEAV